ncbi:MAG: lysylphosphatidylglycerol synthase transmembrane domain-containing protein [Daejeonella sp.]
MKLYISAFKYTLLLIIGIALMVLAFRGQDPDRLISDLQKAHYGWVAASLSACLAAHILRAYRWRMMIGALGHGAPSMLNTTYAVLIGYMANVAFPRMGEISRCGVINKTDSIPMAKLIGTVIVERIIDLLMFAIVIALTLILQFDVLSEFLYRNVILKMNGTTGNLAVLIFAAGILFAALILFYLLMKKKKWGIRIRIYNLFMGLRSGILSVKDVENKAAFIGSSVTIWFLYGLSTYLCFFAISTTSGLNVLAALSTLMFSSLGMIAPVQGGIGAFHWIVSAGLEMYNIPKSEGLAYALLIHTSQTMLVLFTGALSLVMLMLHSRKIKTNEQVSEHTA